MGDLNAFGKFHYYFGGLQVDPKANRARALTTRASAGLSIVDATTGKRTAVQLPNGATVSGPVWSPDGRQVAYIANFDDGSHVYVADAATGKSVQVDEDAAACHASHEHRLDSRRQRSGCGVRARTRADRSPGCQRSPRGRWFGSGRTA